MPKLAVTRTASGEALRQMVQILPKYWLILLPVLLLGVAWTAPARAFLCNPFIPDDLETLAAQLEKRFAQVEHLSPQAVWALMQSDGGAVLIDVREQEEYAMSHLAGAIRVDSKGSPRQLGAVLAGARAGTPIIFYCSVGARSSAFAERAQSFLSAHGIRRSVNLRGGIFAWQRRFPVENKEGPSREVHPFNNCYAHLISDHK